jgi:enoyl-CoA hydratase
LSFRNIKVETLHNEQVVVVYLNRPDVLNALNKELMAELSNYLRELDRKSTTRCFVLTGNKTAFSVGADISMMMTTSAGTPVSALSADYLSYWDAISGLRKPIVAAINGYALGGGLELALACDIIVAGESARLGQPEINVGTMPGAGGTQRLARVLGKYKTMEMVLTGNPISAREAFRLGLVSKVVPDEFVVDEALAIATDLVKKPPLALESAKEAILKSFDLSLSEGLSYERRLFYYLFSSEDTKEGLSAFLQKRKPVYKGT